MTKHLFIPKSHAENATEIANIAASGAGVVKIGATATTLDLTSIDEDEPIQIIWKKASGKATASIDFCMRDLKGVSKLNPSAGTAQATTVTPVLPSVQSKGDEYILRIINTTKGTMDINRKSFSVFHKGVDFTIATLIDAFVAAIGEDEDLLVKATDGSTTLNLTGFSPENHFRLAVDGELSHAAISYSQYNVPSSGTTAKLKALESECMSAQYGFWNRIKHPVIKPDSEVLEDGYTQYVLNITKPDDDKSGMQGTITRSFKLVIAEKNDGIGKAFYDAYHQVVDIPENA